MFMNCYEHKGGHLVNCAGTMGYVLNYQYISGCYANYTHKFPSQPAVANMSLLATH